MNLKTNDIISQNKVFRWLALGTGAILLIPLIAMQFTSEVNWTISDFIVMGMLIFGMGSMCVIAARKVKKKNRLAVGIAFLLAFLAIWAHLAVGIVDTWPLAGS